MDAKEQIANRIKSRVVDDEGFIESFLGRYSDLEQEFYRAANEGSDYFDDWFEVEMDRAWNDYLSYWQKHSEPAKPPLTDGGTLSLKRGRVGGKKAGPWQRQAALGRYLARFAGNHPDIRRFRNQILGGKLLNTGEAKQFICSSLIANHRYHFVRGVDDLGSLLRPLGIENGEDKEGPYRIVARQGKKGPLRSELRPLMLSRTHGLVFPGDVLGPRDIATRRSFFPPAPAPDLILFPYPDQPDRYVVVKEGSVLDELTRISEKRLRGYPIDSDKGSWFVLTGEFIATDPAHISYTKATHFDFSRSTITIEVEGWTSPEEVAGHYRDAQREVVGKAPRSLEAKSLAVFEFVNRNEGKTWEALLQDWNKAHPAQRFKQRGHLHTAYERALDKIVSPEKS